jgi:hypothetical protein
LTTIKSANLKEILCCLVLLDVIPQELAKKLARFGFTLITLEGERLFAFHLALPQYERVAWQTDRGVLIITDKRRITRNPIAVDKLIFLAERW